ncbi:GNAT family N-acetyltransferase [Bacillus sp. V33-4]|uniref:GNAT family N-acetyltransferase n=1 Tax=Bacillus sp. V33-4 TaxID=2054169 RepID=UPI000C76232E|nr:GNAT family N-acetyltransferase [Bacillus sp. V33-4]PLR85417.1 GNAT family N-acetyltransferase [Bacillus sp. V33-4]
MTSVDFYDLKWDTDFFGVKSAKAILYKPLKMNEWNGLKTKFNNYQFISIENRNSESVNAKFIGKDTAAFLVDVNIQFNKTLTGAFNIPQHVTVHDSLEYNEQIIKIANFQFSKFTEDNQLAIRGGDQVYHQWLINSFDKPDKYYALSKGENGDINGFLLHSYFDNACVIELIAVSKTVTNSGIGTSLFKAVEYSANHKGFNIIKVGTQVRNSEAINFYYKVGCKLVGCHQVYHLWNM